MSPSSPQGALSFIADVRWQLLESFALARQEGFADPVGLVVDTSFAYGQAVAERLLLTGAATVSGAGRRATCLPRAVLCGALNGAAPELLSALREGEDEPGHFTVVLLAESGLVVTGTWQELITGNAPGKGSLPARHLRAVKT
jgi:hypothetical protein